MNYINEEFTYCFYPDVKYPNLHRSIDCLVKLEIEFDDDYEYGVSFAIIYKGSDISALVEYLNPDIYSEIESECKEIAEESINISKGEG